jgi:hypothetical protein
VRLSQVRQFYDNWSDIGFFTAFGLSRISPVPRSSVADTAKLFSPQPHRRSASQKAKFRSKVRYSIIIYRISTGAMDDAAFSSIAARLLFVVRRL